MTFQVNRMVMPNKGVIENVIRAHVGGGVPYLSNTDLITNLVKGRVKCFIHDALEARHWIGSVSVNWNLSKPCRVEPTGRGLR